MTLRGVDCGVEPPWMRLVCVAHLTEARLDCDLLKIGVNTSNLLLCCTNRSCLWRKEAATFLHRAVVQFSLLVLSVVDGGRPGQPDGFLSEPA